MSETATLAGGCFWCVEAVYRDLKGVEWPVEEEEKFKVRFEAEAAVLDRRCWDECCC